MESAGSAARHAPSIADVKLIGAVAHPAFRISDGRVPDGDL